MFLKYIQPFFHSLFHTCRGGVAVVQGLSWSEVRDLGLFARRRLREESLPQVAGSLTFATVFALVPLLTLALAIFTTFPLFNTFRAALEQYFVQSVMPKAISNTILGYLTTFSAKATRLSAFGAVALILTSIGMMGLIERVFNRIWRVKRERRWSKRLLVYWAIVTLGPLLVGISLTVTSQVFMATSGLVGAVPFLGALFYTLVSVLLTMGAFTLLYLAVPNRDVDWRDAAWGGLVAALAFEVAKRGFGAFIQQFPTYSRIYGALAALPLFLVWIYLSWMITLVGALLVAALPVVKYERWWHEAAPGGEFVDAMAILKVLHTACHSGDTALVSAGAIRAGTRLGFDEMETLLERMLGQGWVGRVNVEASVRVQWGKHISDGADHWVLLANLNRLSLADVYRLFVFGGMAVNAGYPGLTSEEGDQQAAHDAAVLARQVETAVEEGLNQPLAEYFGKSR
ncbi:MULTISPECIES: YihY family inner membrane protein [unclassified Janthinobacterium]|uniref:YihY family inner membrane protein n=1 Tax=unclassified Janthinobacterium TaxID=2610881 RepID=UPI00034554A7|nr:MULTISPECIES: YihY family inner membrane protein [unclassified Janthinobacterium]MEC5160665.1 membrane protein [Janthinobacterium sp. CG_S6]